MVDGVNRWVRNIGFVGIVFVVLWVLGFFLAIDTPDYDAANSEWVDHFADEDNRATMILGAFSFVLAGLALVWFVALAYESLRSREADEHDAPPPLLLASGVATAAFQVVGIMIVASMAAALSFAPDFDVVPNGELLKVVEQIGIGLLLVPGGWSAALFVAALSMAARNRGMLPSWLTTAGFVVAVLLLASVAFIPFFLFPLWMIVVSIVIIQKRDTAAVGV